jgi:FkbM family methyltransferase
VSAFRRNFGAELQSGQVRLVPKGVWHTRGKLPLKLSGSSNDSHSLIGNDGAKRELVVDLTTIDDVVAELKPARIDFIKMDIEGAETNALRGAQNVLRRWRPRLAISAYHLKDDPANIARIIWSARPDYFIASKDIIGVSHGPVPKVLFFY